MMAAWPTTRPAFSIYKLRTCPLYMVSSGLWFLDRSDPADPFISCKRCKSIPHISRRERNQSFSQVSRHFVHHPNGKFFFSHKILVINLLYMFFLLNHKIQPHQSAWVSLFTVNIVSTIPTTNMTICI